MFKIVGFKIFFALVRGQIAIEKMRDRVLHPCLYRQAGQTGCNNKKLLRTLRGA